jgi:NADPH:quinone reductase-like Zn-dependent oxidoreductase
VSLLGRIVVVLFALWLATMVAGIVWSVGLLGAQWPAMSGDVGDRVVFWGAAFIASGVTASLVFVPMLIAVVVAEAFSLRSIFIYAIGGAALFLLAYQGAGFGRSGYEESIDHAPALVSREFQIAAGAGIAFGFVYWLIAGRKAGRWRERA